MFTGMYNDIVDFELKHYDTISKHFRPPGPTFLLGKTLPRLSFLRISDPSLKPSSQSYHFLPLTFQEYFAARYFVRQWKDGKSIKCLILRSKQMKEIEHAEFLQAHKYTMHYNILWRFVAGIMDVKYEKHTARFFEIIEEEPLDLFGPAHQRLIMHCLGEISTEAPLRKKLEMILS